MTKLIKDRVYHNIGHGLRYKGRWMAYREVWRDIDQEVVPVLLVVQGGTWEQLE